MAVEVRTTPAPQPGRAETRAVRERLDRFDLAILLVFAGVSAWVLALDLWQVVVHDRIWTGTDGLFLTDQMQYLAWIKDASRHVLASNLFVLRGTPADYFQPVVVVSGALTALGAAPWLALLLWKPVAVCASFFATRAFSRRLLSGRWERRAALILALFFGSWCLIFGTWGVIGDLWMGFWSWGYPFGLLAIAALTGALLAYDRARRARRLSYLPPLLGAVASSLHPWQGETLILIVAITELIGWRGVLGTQRLGGTAGLPAAPEPRSARPHPKWRYWRHRLALPSITIAATAAPLAYYAILYQADLSWRLARGASRHSFSFFSIVLAIVPLALFAVLAYRRRPESFIAAAARVWPVTALLVYIVSSSQVSGTPLHAFAGITVPLAVLAVEGAQTIRLRRMPSRRLLPALAVLAVGVATVPATYYELSTADQYMGPQPGNANFITEDENQALEYLANDPRRGGVLTRFYLGTIAPGSTGRRTYVGDCLWSEPDCISRAQTVQQLFDGTLTATQARSFVRSTRARFLLADCQAQANMHRLLGRTISATRRFGCAAVYTIRN